MDPQQSSTSVSCLRYWQPNCQQTISIGMTQWPAPRAHLPSPLEDHISVHTVRREEGSVSQRGMTLVEILIVLALIGIAALVVVVNMQTIIRRFELESGVREFTAFVQDAPSHAKEISAPVFFVWDGANRRFLIARDAAATIVLDRLEIPKELTVTGPAAPVLRCDVYGRAFVGTNLAMMTTVQTMAMTHAYATDASAPTYRFTLSPLWAVEVSR